MAPCELLWGHAHISSQAKTAYEINTAHTLLLGQTVLGNLSLDNSIEENIAPYSIKSLHMLKQPNNEKALVL